MCLCIEETIVYTYTIHGAMLTTCNLFSCTAMFFLQQLYARIVGIVLSANPTTPTVGLSAVMKVLRTDTGIQELTPYLSRCFYQQIRANTKRLVLLRTIIG